MKLGYDGTLFILAFDHRGSFRKKMFGIAGDPTADEHARLEDAKRLVWDGFRAALEAGAPAGEAGILVDEEMGAAVAREAKDLGVPLAMPVELGSFCQGLRPICVGCHCHPRSQGVFVASEIWVRSAKTHVAGF